MNPVPSPAGSETRLKKHLRLRDFFPRSEGLPRADLAVHEYLGLLWARLRGLTRIHASTNGGQAGHGGA
jgi:hypothetical protein